MSLHRVKGEGYAILVTTLPVGGARSRHFPDRGGAGPGQPVPRRAGPCTGGQPIAVRERSATECGRADASRTLRGVEQFADEQLRHLHYIAGVQLRWDDLPPRAASHHRRRTLTGSQLPPHMVPHAKRRMEDQGLTRRWTRFAASRDVGSVWVEATHSSPAKAEVEIEEGYSPLWLVRSVVQSPSPLLIQVCQCLHGATRSGRCVRFDP